MGQDTFHIRPPFEDRKSSPGQGVTNPFPSGDLSYEAQNALLITPDDFVTVKVLLLQDPFFEPLDHRTDYGTGGDRVNAKIVTKSVCLQDIRKI